eukprot:356940-Chlamydomonas_euryale.AAC.5
MTAGRSDRAVRAGRPGGVGVWITGVKKEWEVARGGVPAALLVKRICCLGSRLVRSPLTPPPVSAHFLGPS